MKRLPYIIVLSLLIGGKCLATSDYWIVNHWTKQIAPLTETGFWQYRPIGWKPAGEEHQVRRYLEIGYTETAHPHCFESIGTLIFLVVAIGFFVIKYCVRGSAKQGLGAERPPKAVDSPMS